MAINSDYFRTGRGVSSCRVGLGFLLPAILCAAMVVAALPATAQYPEETMSTKKNGPELRAVAVLEWTGKAGYPTASRLIPISVFDGQQLQDGDLYLARPQPLALDPDVEYELKRDGRTVGLYDIGSAELIHGAWVGYGVWKPLPKPKAPTELAKVHISDSFDENSGRPILHVSPNADKTSSPSKASGSDASAPDQDRPTLHRADSSTDSSNDSGKAGPENPPPNLGPTLHGAPDGSASNSPPDNSGQPTLKEDEKDKKKEKKKRKREKKRNSYDSAYVETVPTAFDPGRPHLLEGKPKSIFSGGVSLVGLPEDMHQEIAVSDAKNTADHPWNYSWADPGGAIKMKAALEEIARKDLGLIPLPAPRAIASQPTPARKRKSPVGDRTEQTAVPLTLAPPAALVDEQFHVFRLAYDSGATLVFSAHTAGTGTQEKYITLIGEPDLYGNVIVLFKNTTNASDLDLTPRMRLVGPVDAMANNRGELLFELRGATQRWFALYQVYNGQVTQLLVTSGGSFATEAGG